MYVYVYIHIENTLFAQVYTKHEFLCQAEHVLFLGIAYYRGEPVLPDEEYAELRTSGRLGPLFFHSLALMISTVSKTFPATKRHSGSALLYP